MSKFQQEMKQLMERYRLSLQFTRSSARNAAQHADDAELWADRDALQRVVGLVNEILADLNE